MKSVEFQKFIDLVTFDQSLIKIQHQITKSQQVLASLVASLERLEAEFSEIKNAKLQSRKAVDAKELYMKVLDQKENALKNKLASISNQKEYKSLHKETLAINAERIAQEQELLALWNKLENLEKNYQIQSASYDEQMQNVACQIQATKEEIAFFESQLNQLGIQRVEKEHDIPQEWLGMYINMKGRVLNPVIPVVNQACDACFCSITPRDLQMLHQSKLLPCRECYRLLYIQENN